MATRDDDATGRFLDERDGDPLGRRRFLEQVGLGTAVAAGAWVTPSIVGVHAAAAATPPDIPFIATFGQAFVTANNDTVTVTLPEAALAGDLLVAIFATNADTSSITGSPGFPFTAVADADNAAGLETVESWILTRVAGAGEPTSYSFTRTAGGVWRRGFRIVLLVVRNTSGLTATPASSAPDANPQGFPVVAATADNLVVHAGVGGSRSNISSWTTAPAGTLVTRYDASPSGAIADGNRRPMVVTQYDQSAAGNTAPTTGVLDGTNPYSVTWTMAFAPL